MINNKPKYLINLYILQKYHFMLLDLDTGLNKSMYRYSFERNTNSLKHVGNRNQRGKFDLNWRRERRNVGSLGIFGPWSLQVESGGTMLFKICLKVGGVSLDQPSLQARYLHQLRNPWARKGYNKRCHQKLKLGKHAIKQNVNAS